MPRPARRIGDRLSGNGLPRGAGVCSDLEGEAGRQLGELVAHELALTGAQLGIALEHVINRFLQPVLNGVQRLLVLQHHFHHCLLPLQNGLFSKFQNKRNEKGVRAKACDRRDDRSAEHALSGVRALQSQVAQVAQVVQVVQTVQAGCAAACSRVQLGMMSTSGLVFARRDGGRACVPS